MISIEQLFRTYGVAITGAVGCGKSTVAHMIEQQQLSVFYADRLARQAVAPEGQVLQKIVSSLGADLLDSDGKLDRVALRSRMIADPEVKSLLEKLIHPEVSRLLESELQRAGLFHHPRTWFYEIPLLFELNRESLFSEVWVAFCPEDMQIERIMARDGVDRTEAEGLVQQQLTGAEKARRGDVVFDTSVSIEDLEAQLVRELKRLQQ